MIDAHVHLWQIGQNGCVWPTADLTAIHRNFELRDLKPLAAAHALDGVLLVQSQENAQDTNWLLSMASDALVKGVIGWADLAAPLPVHPLLCGLRPMVQDRASNWYDDPAIRPGVLRMEELGLVLDALIRPRHLLSLCGLARRHPKLSIVIDHAAKLKVGDIRQWEDDMHAIATYRNVVCKMSGVITEPGVEPLVDAVFETLWHAFGPERLIWGSDWPVVTLAGDYTGWLERAMALVPDVHHAAVFDGNARRVYGLN